MKPSALTGSVSVLAAAALWGTVGPAQVLATASAPPIALGAARLVVGGVALGMVAPVLDRRGRTSRSRMSGRMLGWLVLAAVSTAAYQVAFLSSVQRTGAALATVVTLGVTPPSVGLLARLAGAERLTRAWLLGTVAAIGGTTLLLLPGAGAGVDPVGVVLGAVGGACYAVYTLAAKRLLASAAPTFASVAGTLALGGVLLLPFAGSSLSLLAETRSVLLVGWLALPATAIGYLLFVSGLRGVSASTAGTLSLAEPLVAAVLGVALLGERLSITATAGAVTLLAGLVAVTLPACRPKIGIAGDG